MKKYVIIFFLTLLILNFGCKKYEDGPIISLRTKNHRLEGKWNVSSYTINGVEQMNKYNAYDCSLCSGFDYLCNYSAIIKFEWDINENGKATLNYTFNNRLYDSEKSLLNNCLPVYKKDTVSKKTEMYYWEFYHNKEYLILKGNDEVLDFEIIKLKENQVKLKLINRSTVQYILDKV